MTFFTTLMTRAAQAGSALAAWYRPGTAPLAQPPRHRVGTALLGLLTVSGAAWAHGGPSCKVPAEQRQPTANLESQLRTQGWQYIRKIKLERGCYEVYGKDAKGQTIEVFFNPKTLEKIDVTQ